MGKAKDNFIGLFVVLGKIGGKIIPVIAKLSKLTKVALVGASFLAYAYMFTWQFAVMIIVQLLIHEYGHIWAMKRCGIKTKGIYLIPFVGGAAVASEEFKSRKDEVFVALMGPVFGLGCALLTFIGYLITNDPMYAAGASWMALMNLFNLLPINPLDGGRVAKSIAFSMNSWLGLTYMIIALLGCILLAWFVGAALFIFLIWVAIFEAFWEFKKHRKKGKLVFYGVTSFRAENVESRKQRGEVPLKLENGDEVFPALDNDPINRKHCDDCYTEYNYPAWRHLSKCPKCDSSYKNMTIKEIILSGVAYVSLGVVLYLFMHFTNHIPGAKLAMELLK